MRKRDSEYGSCFATHNPYSEAGFKTLKYHPGFPKRFRDKEHALAFCRTFFPWYCDEHRHGGIAMLTPADVFHGRTESVLAKRQAALNAAFAAHPERFVRGRSLAAPLPSAVWINKPPEVPATMEAVAQ